MAFERELRGCLELMFGSPSGPLHDPTGALPRGGTIEEGWLVARRDLPADMVRDGEIKLGDSVTRR